MATILQFRTDRNTKPARPRLRGNNQCRCSACGELFASVATFHRHRTGDYQNSRRCLTHSEMLARGWIQNGSQFWIRGHRPNIAPVLPPCAQNRRLPEALTQVAGAS
jgi:hypothetical protein